MGERVREQSAGAYVADRTGAHRRTYCICIVLLATAILQFSLAGGAHSEPQWQRLRTVKYTLNNKQDAIACASTKRCWYGNGTGRVYRTDDGGERWKQVWRGRGTYVRALEFVDNNIGFLGNIAPGYFPNVGDRQSLYVTRDGGARFDPVRDVSGKTIAGICAIDIVKVEGGAAAIRAGGRVGGPARMMESLDGGATWTSRDMSDVTGMVLDIKFIDENVGFVAGASEAEETKAHARILKTTDGGRTWRAVFNTDRAGDVNWKLSFPNSTVGYGTIISYQAPKGEARGYVVKTDDGGETWRRIRVTNDSNWIPYGVGFINEQHGFVGGSTGGYETRDGGVTWRSAALGLSANKFRFVTRNDGGVTAFAIGQDVWRLELPTNIP